MTITASCGHTLTEEEDLGTTMYQLNYDISPWLGETVGYTCGEYCDQCRDEMLAEGTGYLNEDDVLFEVRSAQRIMFKEE